MSKFLNKKILPLALAGMAAFTSCRKDIMSDLKPTDKTPIVTTPVITTPVAAKQDTLDWPISDLNVYGDLVLNGKINRIGTIPADDDREYYAEFTHPKGTTLLSLAGQLDPNGKCKIEMQTDAEPSYKSVKGSIYTLSYASFYPPQSTRSDTNSRNVKIWSSHTDASLMAQWGQGKAEVLKSKANGAINIILDANKYPGTKEFYEHMIHHEKAALTLNQDPNTGFWMKKGEIQDGKFPTPQ